MKRGIDLSSLKKYEAHLNSFLKPEIESLSPTKPKKAILILTGKTEKKRNRTVDFPQEVGTLSNEASQPEEAGLLWVRKKTMSEVPKNWVSRVIETPRTSRLDGYTTSASRHLTQLPGEDRLSLTPCVKKVKKSLEKVDFVSEELFEKEKRITGLLQDDMRKTHSGLLQGLKRKKSESQFMLPRNVSFLGETKNNFIKTIQNVSFRKKKDVSFHSRLFDLSDEKNSSKTSFLDLVDLDRLKERVTEISSSGERIKGELIIPSWFLEQLPCSKLKPLREASLDPILAITNHIKTLDSKKQAKILNSRLQTDKFSLWLVQVVGLIRKKDYQSIQGYFQDFQVIFTLTLRELVSQIRSEVKERGDLLELVWDSYIKTFSFLFESIRREWFSTEKEFLKNESQIHKIYEKDRERMKTKIEELAQELHLERTRMESMQKELLYLDKKKKTLELEFIHAKREGKLLRDELVISHNDNTKLLDALGQKLMKSNKGKDEQESSPHKGTLNGQVTKLQDPLVLSSLIKSIKSIENSQKLISVLHTNSRLSYQDLMTEILTIDNEYVKYDKNAVGDTGTDTRELEEIEREKRLNRLKEKETFTDNQEKEDKETRMDVKTEDKSTKINKKLLKSKLDGIFDDDLDDKEQTKPDSMVNEQKAESLNREINLLVEDSKKMQSQRTLKSMSSIIFDDVMNKNKNQSNLTSMAFNCLAPEKFDSEIKRLSEKFEYVTEKLRKENERLRIELYERDLEMAQFQQDLLEDERIIDDMMSQQRMNTSSDLEKIDTSPKKTGNEGAKSRFYAKREKSSKEEGFKGKRDSELERKEIREPRLKKSIFDSGKSDENTSKENKEGSMNYIQDLTRYDSKDMSKILLNDSLLKETAIDLKEKTPEAKSQEKLPFSSNLNIRKALQNTKTKLKITMAFRQVKKKPQALFSSGLSPPTGSSRNILVPAIVSNSKHVHRLFKHAMSYDSEKPVGDKAKELTPRKAGKTLPRSSMLKLIAQIYGDMLKAKDFSDFRTVVYENGLNKFGLQKMADDRFLQIIETCRFYKLRNKRISTFGRFLQVYNPLHEAALAFYVNSLSAMDIDGYFHSFIFLIVLEKGQKFSAILCRTTFGSLSPASFPTFLQMKSTWQNQKDSTGKSIEQKSSKEARSTWKNIVNLLKNSNGKPQTSNGTMRSKMLLMNSKRRKSPKKPL